MQENEFEKKVQQKLDALQVQPTDEVWQKIKVQVAQKKQKRRFAFLFLVAALIGITALVTVMFNKSMEQKQIAIEVTKQDIQTTTVTAPSAANNGSDLTAANKTSRELTATNAEINNAEAKQNNPQEISNTIVNKHKEAGTQKVTLSNSLPVETVVQINSKRKTKGNLKTITIQPSADDVESNKDEIVTAIVENKKIAELDEAGNIENKNQNKIDVESNTAAVENKTPSVTTIETKQHAEEKKKEENPVAPSIKKNKKDQDRKWGIAFSVSGGKSFVNTSSQEKSLSQDYTSGGSGNSPGSNGSLSGNYYTPSPLEPGAGFSAGVGVYRKLSSSLKIIMGLQFSFNSLSINTGTKIDSVSTRESFRYGNSSAYTNKYHYLSIPVSVSTTLFKIGKREIIMDAGASFSRLLTADVLEFDATQGRYYADASRLNKTFVGFSLSAGINLAAADKPALYIGPQFNYNVTPLSSTGLYANRRVTFIGLRLQKNLWK